MPGTDSTYFGNSMTTLLKSHYSGDNRTAATTMLIAMPGVSIPFLAHLRLSKGHAKQFCAFMLLIIQAFFQYIHRQCEHVLQLALASRSTDICRKKSVG